MNPENNYAIEVLTDELAILQNYYNLSETKSRKEDLQVKIRQVEKALNLLVYGESLVNVN